MRRAALCLLLILLAAAPAQAQGAWRWSRKQAKEIAALERQVQVGADGFPHRIEGKRWVVETQVDARFTAELSLFMDLFAAAFDELLEGLEAEPRIERTPTVQVYASKDAYAARHASGTRGYYDYRWDEGGAFTTFHLYTYVEKPAERSFAAFYQPILLHEGTHVLLRRLLGKADNAKWFDEGVATYFQFWDLRASVKANRKTRYGRSFYRPDVAAALKAGPPALAPLLALKDDFDPDSMGPQARRNYALSENLIDLLLSSKDGAELFKRAFARLRAGESPLLTPEEQAKVEPQWQAHLRGVAR